jgi:hypothetical protein
MFSPTVRQNKGGGDLTSRKSPQVVEKQFAQALYFARKRAVNMVLFRA